jgi:hypothetical protein
MILVVSATGMIDGMIPDSLLDQERQARALVRSPDPSRGLGARGAETLVGDLKDRAPAVLSVFVQAERAGMNNASCTTAAEVGTSC